MRRFIPLLMTLALLVGLALPASAATATSIVLDGRQTTVQMDAGTGLAALDQFAAAIGAQYEWAAARGGATVVLGHRSVVLTADTPKAIFNGAVRTMRTTPVRSGNGLLVPVAEVAEALGLYVAGEKDGSLVIRTGRDLVLSMQGFDYSSDQIISQRELFRTAFSDPQDPESAESMMFATELNLHVYQNQFIMKMQMEMNGETPGTMEAAYIDGKAYAKEDEKGWVTDGEPAPFFELLMPALADAWSESLLADNPFLSEAVITVIGTSEMDGVQVVHVMLSLSEAASTPGTEIYAAFAGMAEDEGGSVQMRFVQTFAIDPETGVVHHAVSGVHLIAQTPDGGSGEFLVETDTRIRPVSVPIELPADFPR